MRLTVLQRRGPISYHVSSVPCEYFTLSELCTTFQSTSFHFIWHSNETTRISRLGKGSVTKVIRCTYSNRCYLGFDIFWKKNYDKILSQNVKRYGSIKVHKSREDEDRKVTHKSISVNY